MQAADLNAGAIGAVRAAGARHGHIAPAGAAAAYTTFAQIPDLVNGDRATFRYIFVSAGLPDEYFWISDAFYANQPAIDSDATMKDAICRRATGLALRIAGAGMDDAKARNTALLVAASRLSIQRAWAVVDADIVGTQITGVTRAGGANAPIVLAADGTLPHDSREVGSAAEFAAELALVEAAYDTIAATCIPAAMQCAVGMPVCNGVTITYTLVHHYVDPHKQVCDAVVDQHFKGNMALPAGMSRDDVKDAICHKSAHPIQSPILVGLARNPEVKLRLAAIGHGSATVRLPAKFSPEKAIGAMEALVLKAKSAAASSNVAIDEGPVQAASQAITAAIVDDPTQAGIAAAEELLADFRKAHGFAVAFCAGYMTGLFEDIRANARQRSCITAKSLESLLDEEVAGMSSGAEHYALAMKWKKARAREGHLPGLGLFGAPTPAAMAPPEVEADAAAARALARGNGINAQAAADAAAAAAAAAAAGPPGGP